MTLIIRAIKYYVLPAVLLFIGCFSSALFNQKTHSADDNFDVQHIRSIRNLEAFPNCTAPSFSVEKAKEIFDKPFTYLKRGVQFFVFESADHQYVLKFYKQHRLKEKPVWLAKALFPSLQAPWEKKNLERKKLADALFGGVVLAYQNLPEETGILAIQFNKKGPFHQTVRLVDKLGIQYQVDLARHPFILQKKICTSENYFKEITKKNDEKKIKSALNNILTAIEARCQKGIFDEDTAVLQNLGFTAEGEAIFIDFGQYVLDANIADWQRTQEEKVRRVEKIKEWAEKECPRLVTYLDRTLIDLLQTCNS